MTRRTRTALTLATVAALGATTLGCISLAPAPTATAVLPTSTLAPASLTVTPTVTLTPAPVLLQPSATFTPASPPSTAASGTLAWNALLCKVKSQAVPNGTHFDPGARFDMGWKVKNLGDLAWEPGDVEFGFVGGQKMYVSSSFSHLQTTVDHLDTVFLGTDMVAPKQSGRYTAFWGLRQGELYFCRMSVSITVP